MGDHAAMRPLLFVLAFIPACIRGEPQSRDASVAETTEATETVASTEVVEQDISNTCPNLVCDPGENKLICPDDCYCTNNTCDPGETRQNCPADCGCGNGVCDGNETPLDCKEDCCSDVVCGDCDCNFQCGERIENCPGDCAVEGDGIMSPGEAECGKKLDACRCIIDNQATGAAGCGDGCCIGYLCGETPANCANDCGTACGDGACDAGETRFTCEADCKPDACGNGTCEGPDETPENCPSDCGSSCGNCNCEANESFITCPPDCGFCGDGICSNCPRLDEITNCPVDCE